mgnify:CR=1 FL=1
MTIEKALPITQRFFNAKNLGKTPPGFVKRNQQKA